MTEEREESWQKFGIVALLIIGAVVLELAGHHGGCMSAIMLVVFLL